MPASLLDLPSELLDTVLLNLQKRQLKAIRLTARDLSKAAASHLFRSYTLYPHLESFDKLLCIAKDNKIGPLVRLLEYNTAFRCLPRLPFRAFGLGRRETMTQAQHNELSSYLRTLHKNTLMGGNTSDELTQMEFFQRIVPRLSGLRSIRILETPDGFGLPDFYARSLPNGCRWIPYAQIRLDQEIADDPEPRQSHALAMLAGARQLATLNTLEVNGMQWDDFLGQPDLFKRPILFRDALGRLTTLELKIRAGGTDHLWDGDVILNLQDMLQLAGALERLVLWFRDVDEFFVGGEQVYDFKDDEHCRSIFQLYFDDDPVESSIVPELIPRLTWSLKLRYLELRGLVCTFKEFKKILRQCCTSLRILNLSGLILLPEVRRGRRACLVHMFKWMQKHLQLSEFEPHGPFTNGGRQTWIIRGLPSPEGSIYKKLVAFVTSPDPTTLECPIDHLAVPEGYFDLACKTYQKETPKILHEPKYQGDESFLTNYDDHDDVPSEAEETEDDASDESELTNESDGQDSEASNDEWESASNDSLD